MAKKYTTLSEAVMADDAKAAKAMIDAGADINEIDCRHAVTDNSKPMRCTPLHLAALFGKAECLKMLLKAKANGGVRSSNRKTVLHLAADGNSNVACVRMLIDAGADVNAKDRHGNTALHLAAGAWGFDVKCVRLLIEAGADVNAKDRFGNTALHCAAERDIPNAECVRVLLDAGADVNARDNDGRTPKERSRYEEILSMLDEQKLTVELPEAGGGKDTDKGWLSI